MRSYILQRLLLTIPVVVAVSMVVFTLVSLLPGDIAASTLGQGATPERLDALRDELGLNRSIPERYVDWASHALRGDLGESMRTHQPVAESIKKRIPVTFELAILASLISLAVALPLGTIAAVKQDSIFDQAIRLVSIIGLSIPQFWLGILLILLPAIWWQWSIPVGYRTFTEDPITNLQQVGFPAFAIGVSTSAFIIRLLRSSLLEVLSQDYMRTARAKGLRQQVAVIRHGMKNAFIPVLTVLGLQFTALLGGTVIMEQIYGLPGLGRLTLDALLTRDYPMIQGTVLFLSVVIVTMNLLIDVLYGFFDPRIRFGGQ